jgi:hypothetical protein
MKGLNRLVGAVAEGDDVVALDGEIVEGGGVAVPAGEVGILAADDVSGGEHLDFALALRALDESDFEFDGLAFGELARSQEKDAAGADIPGNEGHGEGFGLIIDANQAQRQRQSGALVIPALVRDSDRVGRNARKPVRARLTVRGNDSNCLWFCFVP